MAGLVTATANSLLDYFLRAQSYSPPSTVYMGLYSVLPDAAGSGATELSGTGYARKSLAAAIWTAAASRKLVNTADVEFTASAGGSWGTAVGFGLFSGSSGGTPLVVGTMPSLAITSGLAVIFAATKLEVEFTWT